MCSLKYTPQSVSGWSVLVIRGGFWQCRGRNYEPSQTFLGGPSFIFRILQQSDCIVPQLQHPPPCAPAAADLFCVTVNGVFGCGKLGVGVVGSVGESSLSTSASLFLPPAAPMLPPCPVSFFFPLSPIKPEKLLNCVNTFELFGTAFNRFLNVGFEAKWRASSGDIIPSARRRA